MMRLFTSGRIVVCSTDDNSLSFNLFRYEPQYEKGELPQTLHIKCVVLTGLFNLTSSNDSPESCCSYGFIYTIKPFIVSRVGIWGSRSVSCF